MKTSQLVFDVLDDFVQVGHLVDWNLDENNFMIQAHSEEKEKNWKEKELIF